MIPIGFSIPECKLATKVPDKDKIVAHIIPGNLNTYIFSNENDYYKDYQRSLFGLTNKKGGWDCLRHYEILANGCIPIFTDINQCPERTLTHLPKELLKEALKIYNDYIINGKDKLDYEKVSKITNDLLDYTKNKLTTKKMASYIIEKTKQGNVNKILFLSGQTGPDYLRCLTLHGFKELYSKECHDYPCIEHLYTDLPEDKASRLYGKGITYTRLLEKEKYRNDTLDMTIKDDIINKNYDLIIFGSLARGLPYFEIIKDIYPKDKVIFLYGEDTSMEDKFMDLLEQGYKVFVREIY